MRDGGCRGENEGGWVSVGSFVGGLIALAVVELLLLIYVFAKLLTFRAHKKQQNSASSSAVGIHTSGTTISFNLQGNVWVAHLPQGDWSKLTLKQASSKDKKKEKEAPTKDASKREGLQDCLEIWPVRKHAILNSNVLYLRAADGTEESILLDGCEVLAVSSGHGPGGKWARKMPLKVHHDERAVYHGCNDCLLYLDTGWEKETWCEVLRATAKLGSSSNDWFLQTKREYQDYTQRVETHLPYVNKFHATAAAATAGGGEVTKFGSEMNTEEKLVENKSEEGLSRKKLIWKKLTRRSSKGKETKDTKSLDALEELADFTRRISAVSSSQGQDDGSSSRKKDLSSSIDLKNNISSSRDEDVNNAVHASSVESKMNLSKEIDQGLLCLNMIIGRIYFDFYHSPSRVASIQRLIQKQLSKMKTPSYIKSITIAELDLGKSPPYATALRMLPADAAGALALEFDLQWQGVGSIACETRLEVRDASAQEKVASQVGEPGLAGDAAAALLTGIGNDLNISGTTRVLEDGNKKGGLMQSVKSMISRVAEQVSQVPLILKIRCESIKGTGLLRMRAPPTDRMWFSFKEMPELDLVPEPCIGERRFNSGPLGTFIVQHLKVQLREILVMPNCEDLFTAWMMAEKDDWLPQSVVPVAFTSAQVSESEKQNLRSSNIGSQAKPNSDQHQSVQQLVSLATLKTDVLPPPDSNNSNRQHRRSMSMTRLLSEVSKGGLQPASQAAAAPSTVTPTTMSRFSHDVSNGPQTVRPSGVTTTPLSTPSSSVREETGIEFSKTLSLDRGESRAALSERGFEAGLLSRGELRAFSGRELEVGGGSDRRTDESGGTIASFSLRQSEGSVSDSDVQYLASHDGEQDLDLQQKMQSSRSSKMILLGKMGAKLDEKRRLVLEKLREKKVIAT
ncbi:unnamed protein product [Sphagnum jensenii]|uniref:SMP-LTD domain-containing protein n=1 Tax=Sphagnum jensenii TaxID=128206 RepID=A0ABP0WLN2_9BRYO